MHYSPQALQLGAQVQAKVDAGSKNGSGPRFAISYGDAAPPPKDDTTKLLIGGAVTLGLIWLFGRRRD